MAFGWPHITKPSRGARIDRTHPLARNLRGFYALNEGAGLTVHDATGNIPLTVSGYPAGTSPWSSDSAGMALNRDSAAAAGQAIGSIPKRLQVGWPISFAMAFTCLGAPTSNSRPFWAYDSTASAMYFEWAFFWQFSDMKPVIGIGLDYTSYVIGAPLVTGQRYTLGATVTASEVYGYNGGSLYASYVSSPTAPSYNTSPVIGFDGQSGGGSNILVDWACWWDRVLSAGEHAAIATNPWQVFDPGPLRTWVFFPAPTVLLGNSSGGAVVGGSAAPSVAFAPAARGGPVAGGSASPSAVFAPSAAGGPVVGGAASGTGNTVFTATAAGGAVLGGLASPSAVFSGASAGGAVLGGSAQGSANNVYTVVASGGPIVGGLAAPSAAFAGASSGGVLAGGSAAPSAVFSLVAAGGPIVGGAASGYIPTTFVLYVDPRQVALVAEDGSLGDIDPTGATILSDDASPAGIDPTQVTILQ